MFSWATKQIEEAEQSEQAKQHAKIEEKSLMLKEGSLDSGETKNLVKKNTSQASIDKFSSVKTKQNSTDGISSIDNTKKAESVEKSETIESQKDLAKKLFANSFDSLRFNSPHSYIDPMPNLLKKITEAGEDSHYTEAIEQIHEIFFRVSEGFGLTKESLVFDTSSIQMTPEDFFYPFVRIRYLSEKEPSLTLMDTETKERFLNAFKEEFEQIKRSHKGPAKENLFAHVKIVDEGGFIYIRYRNIISHILRLTPRYDRMARINALHKEEHYFTLVIDDVGEDLQIAKDFIDLPFPVILSLWPHSPYSSMIAHLAHENGLPVFLHQPMEAFTRENYTPNIGEGGVYVYMDEQEVFTMLEKNLLILPYLIGVNNHMGSRFSSDENSVRRFLKGLQSLRPQLIVLDSLTHYNSILADRAYRQGMLSFKRDFFIDNESNVDSILKELDKAYSFSQEHRKVIAIGHARPHTLKALKLWDKKQNENLKFTLPGF